MPDIALCTNMSCPMRRDCARATAPPDEHWQAYCAFVPGPDGCLYFSHTSDKIMRSHTSDKIMRKALEEREQRGRSDRHWLSRLVRHLGGDAKEFYGWPLSWFEPCDYINADGVVDTDGKLGNADHGGHYAAFRMRDEKRKRAGWPVPNRESVNKHFAKCGTP